MGDPYSRLDLWETLKAATVEAAPLLTTHVQDARREAWREVPARLAELLAVMVALDQPLENAALRRRTRGVLMELLAELDPGLVRESGADEGPVILRDRQRQQLLKTLRWLESGSLQDLLGNISGPQAAVALVARQAPALDGLRAHRWLAAVGYPVAVPDAGRQRFLMRMGWIDSASGTRQARAAALAAMEKLARDAQAPLGEINVVLGTFTGGNGKDTRDAARCLAQPVCGKCPVTAQCLYYRLNGASGARSQPGSQTLAASMREADRPREKLEREGADRLGEDELVAILLRTGSGQENALQLARRLLAKAGTLDRLAAMSVAELTRLPGMGRVKAVTLKAAFELARRFKEAPGKEQPGSVRGARMVADLLGPRFVGARQEEFHAVLLNTKNEVLRTVLVTRGTLNQSLVHPREAFTEAIRDAAYAVIFVHNHPSGDPAPSRDDHTVTKRLVEVGDLMGVKVLDHVIIGTNGRFFSFADEGVLR
ncbi:MAG: DNA repair protein RadC [Sumerlaeia bacterium]